MSAPARPTCEWFLGCRHKAVALVAHPRKPTPACQVCIDRMGLRGQIIAAILEPTGDDQGVTVAHRSRVEHAAEHFFKGVCICPCDACAEHVGDGLVMCTCPDCPASGCGAKKPTRAGVA